MTKERVELFEVGPRDGLQNEPGVIPVSAKVALVDLLSRAGFARIEAASFVSPKWVPQMAGSGQVMSGITRAPGVRYAALVPNMQGFKAALTGRVDEIAVFASASEGFSRANLNATITQSLERFVPVIAAAKLRGIPVRGYVSCIVECPFDGAIAPGQTAKIATALQDLGCSEISLGDTVGRGTPQAVDAMLHAVTQAIAPGRLAGHFHDTSGQALANIDVALGHGIRVFDAAVGGLGGCPYAPGAAGNVATGAVRDHLHAQGFETGLDGDILARATRMARDMTGKGHAEHDV